METLNEILNTLLPHWPFVAVLAILGMFYTVSSRNIFTHEQAEKKGAPRWFWWTYKTLPAHPVVTGMLVGLIWRNPEMGVDTLAASMSYFGFAGVTSVFFYEFVNALAKKRGVELDLPGDSAHPEAPDPEETEE